jgi:uncharacterized protein Veg
MFGRKTKNDISTDILDKTLATCFNILLNSRLKKQTDTCVVASKKHSDILTQAAGVRLPTETDPGSYIACVPGILSLGAAGAKRTLCTYIYGRRHECVEISPSDSMLRHPGCLIKGGNMFQCIQTFIRESSP